MTDRPRQVSRVVRAGPRTKTGRPPNAVVDLEHQMEADLAQGKLAVTSATVGVLLDRYFEHLGRKGLSPKTLDTYRRYVRMTIRPALGDRMLRR